MEQLYDNHGRRINYVRLAITDRCNLRCFYCMPEEGIKYVARQELLSYEEMVRLIRVLVNLGIEKLRITGGEPFLRKDMMQFLENVSQLEGLKQINITSNGTVIEQHLPKLKALGINSINLSLDTLNKKRFFAITRRDEFEKVMRTFHSLLEHGIKTKINAVVMEGRNTDDLIPMAELTAKYPVNVRYIEEMPFNGTGSNYPVLTWNHKKILEHLKTRFPDIEKIPDPPNSTSYNYQIPGHQGTIGIIAAYSRTFCGSCNRIRITPQGTLKTCLYDNGVFNIKNLMREGATDEQMATAFKEAFNNRAKDGYEAEKNRMLNNPISESMSTIGG